MSANILAGGALLLLAAMVALAWIVWRGSARAATLEDIAARMAKNAGKARTKGTTLLQRTADFSYYDQSGEDPLPHIMCLAMQDVIFEAEVNGCLAVDTPRVFVDLDRKKVRVVLEVLHVASLPVGVE
ncbi:hypothetical protein [uncultured Actinomyces sp.]|uniref:hypothetical protein n=1 Tax=uncultured Actinomyces sp. TaxID=249061 RepID=UPI0028E56EAC|nr:hypothetical protein [uncultured Actinomyces sp.]